MAAEEGDHTRPCRATAKAGTTEDPDASLTPFSFFLAGLKKTQTTGSPHD
jgi:hypothetical protein